MKEQLMLEQMENICEEYILESKQIVAGRKHRLTRVLRAALIAACVCAVLIGGAFAAEILTEVPIITFFQNRVNDSSAGSAPYLDGYDVVFPGMKNFPAEAFSEELKDWLAIPREERGTLKYFESLEEAEDFLGIELINDLAQGDMQKRTHSIWFKDVHKSLHCYAVVGDKDGQLTGAALFAYYTYKDNVQVNVTVSVTTESAQEIAFMSVGNSDGSDYSCVEYTTPSGLTAVIIKGEVSHRAYFSANGAGFMIEVVNEPIEVVHEILDAIEF